MDYLLFEWYEIKKRSNVLVWKSQRLKKNENTTTNEVPCHAADYCSANMTHLRESSVLVEVLMMAKIQKVKYF